MFKCHGEKTCYEIRTCSDYSFYSCGLDGSLKFVDLRQYNKCELHNCQEHTLIKTPNGITAIAINPLIPYHLVCGGLDGVLRFYDTRMLTLGQTDNQSILTSTSQSAQGIFAVFNPLIKDNSQLDALGPNTKRITSVQYDRTGSQVLASYQSNYIYLLDWKVRLIQSIIFIKHSINRINLISLDKLFKSSLNFSGS